MIATVDDFNLGIKNIPELDDTDLPISEEVEAYIAQYEIKLLRHLLGYELAKNLELYNDLVIPVADPVYDNILNGKEFGEGGEKDIYEGIKNAIIYYVFWNYLNETQTKLTSSGEIAPNVENSKQMSSIPRLVIVWNLMVDDNINLITMLNENLAIYPTWDAYSETEKGHIRIENLISKINIYGI